MAIVVTGSSGFIGRHVVELLAGSGYAVTGLDRRPRPEIQPGRHLVVDVTQLMGGGICGGPHDRASGRAGATCPGFDPAVLEEARDALRSAEAVWHLAGCPGVHGEPRGIATRRRRDNVGAAEIVGRIVPPGVPLLVTSSSSVYGGACGTRPSIEDDPLSPRGDYARSKVAVEERCAVRAARGGLVCIARPFTAAGEGQRSDMALARWLAAARRHEPLTVFGSIDRRRDVVDVRHLARALVELLERGATGAVNIGTGRSVTLADMIGAVGRALGVRPRVLVVPAAPEEVEASLADVRRQRRLLGWTPATDLDALVARQAAAQAGSGPTRPVTRGRD